ncbi:MAG: glycosyltransferase [Anaerolineales bacterium]|nr:glycosyltransferase [Anaerolineales bacterium]
MTVLFHVTMPDSPLASLDAVVQEIHALQKQRPGSRINHLYPGQKPGTRLPRRFWGLGQLPRLRRAEKTAQLHHIFNPDFYPFAALRWLTKPIVYTAVTGIGQTPKAVAQTVARQVHTLIVPTQADQAQLAQWGITNTAVIGTGIDTQKFSHTPPPAKAPFTLLMGSAPWTEAQFRSKGIEALLAAAQQRPDLHLVFLWRGLLYEQMQQRVQAAGLADRITIFNEPMDVNRVLAGVHAAVVLAESQTLVKAFPHSLLESLVAGKPILVSQPLALAQYVQENACGVVVTAVSPQQFLAALDQLIAHYDQYQQNAQRIGPRDFGLETFVQAHLALYKSVTA